MTAGVSARAASARDTRCLQCSLWSAAAPVPLLGGGRRSRRLHMRERTPLAELTGYADSMRATRDRLLPEVW